MAACSVSNLLIPAVRQFQPRARRGVAATLRGVAAARPPTHTGRYALDRVDGVRRAAVSSDVASVVDRGPVTSFHAQDDSETPEVVFYDGKGSKAEVLVSVVLGLVTLLWLPLTFASLGRSAWITYRFTDKKISVITASPIVKRRVDVAWKEVSEVNAVARCFGLWGDMVIKLKDGQTLEITAMEMHEELRDYARQQIQKQR